MRYRALGTTGLTVSEIGFGGLGIGGVSADVASYGPADDKESLAALERAYDAGVTFYDTSPDYGQGHSEELIGLAFRGKRERVVIASKVGFVSLSRPNDESAIRESLAPSCIRQTLEGTLRRLESDYLDLLQLHSPPLEVLRSMPEALATLGELQREGSIRAFGISLRSPRDGPAAINEFNIPVLQVNLNLIDQRALESGLLAAAAGQGIGIIVRTPLAYGFLSGRYTGLAFDSRDHRASWSPEQLKAWTAAPAYFAPLNAGTERTLAQLAIGFCLSPPAVATVIAGMQRVSEVEENVAVAALPPLAAADVAAIENIYRQHDFFVRSPAGEK